MSSLGAQATKLAGVLGVGFGLRAFIQNTVEAQNAIAQLNAVIKSTGGAAGFTTPQLAGMAANLQKVSTFSDEAIMGAQGLLLTFNKIRGETFKGATQAVLDLATAMHGDLQGAAIQVGKALQDPVKGITALRRVGVSFSQAQQDVIKSLFETGHAAEAQALILKELQMEFGGSALAARNTLGGALTALKNAFGDTLEVSSNASTGIVGAINSIADAMPKVRSMANSFFTALDLGFGLIAIGAQKANIAMAKFQLQAAAMMSHIPGLKGFAWNQANQATAILGSDQGAGTLAALDKLRAEMIAQSRGEGMFGGAPPSTGGRKGVIAGIDEGTGSADAAKKAAAAALQASEQYWRSQHELWQRAVDKVADLREEARQYLLDNPISALVGQSIMGNIPDFSMPNISSPFEGLKDTQKETLRVLGILKDQPTKGEQLIASTVSQTAQIIASSISQALNIGGGGKGSSIFGSIGGIVGAAAGSLLGPAGSVVVSAIGSAVGGVVGGLAGSLFGGLFDHHTKAVNTNTAAIDRNTAALVLFAPAGFKTEQYRYDATNIQKLQKDLRIFATRGGARTLATP